jgi:hypothetical protein
VRKRLLSEKQVEISLFHLYLGVTVNVSSALLHGRAIRYKSSPEVKHYTLLAGPVVTHSVYFRVRAFHYYPSRKKK